MKISRFPKYRNHDIHHSLRNNPSKKDIDYIFDFLNSKGSFEFPTLSNSLFSAAILNEESKYTGYSSVWVRDNIYVAFAHYLTGDIEIARKNLNTFLKYFQKHRSRFVNIIESEEIPLDPMERPNIRFDGETLEEIDQNWNHAQNDALGYFLWLYSTLVKEERITPNTEDLETLTLFPVYFQKIQYWQDEDSGHWEEDRKVSASSIGVVVAALKEFREFLVDKPTLAEKCKYKGNQVQIEHIDSLIDSGQEALQEILPFECIQPGEQNRKYDSALLFLIYPLEIVSGDIADQILENVINNLQGEHGIFRYLRDTFWCKDYRDLPENIRTTISSEREAWMANQGKALQDGEEAQWCIFDPIISCIYGRKYQQTNNSAFLEKQTEYFNRSLKQITENFDCPELYYLQDGEYIHNDATPLLWAQANLLLAIRMMQQNLNG